jgi:hypothetical protein
MNNTDLPYYPNFRMTEAMTGWGYIYQISAYYRVKYRGKWYRGRIITEFIAEQSAEGMRNAIKKFMYDAYLMVKFGKYYKATSHNGVPSFEEDPHQCEEIDRMHPKNPMTFEEKVR